MTFWTLRLNLFQRLVPLGSVPGKPMLEMLLMLMTVTHPKKLKLKFKNWQMFKYMQNRKGFEVEDLKKIKIVQLNNWNTVLFHSVTHTHQKTTHIYPYATRTIHTAYITMMNNSWNLHVCPSGVVRNSDRVKCSQISDCHIFGHITLQTMTLLIYIQY